MALCKNDLGELATRVEAPEGTPVLRLRTADGEVVESGSYVYCSELTIAYRAT